MYANNAALWGTRITEDSSKSDIKIKTTLRELIIYIVFLILLLISNSLLLSTSLATELLRGLSIDFLTKGGWSQC